MMGKFGLLGRGGCRARHGPVTQGLAHYNKGRGEGLVCVFPRQGVNSWFGKALPQMHTEGAP